MRKQRWSNNERRCTRQSSTTKPRSGVCDRQPGADEHFMSEERNRIGDEEVDRLLAQQRRERLVHRRNTVLIVAGVAVVALVLAALIFWRVRSSKTAAEAE